MKILALDLGSKTGWALNGTFDSLTCGTESFQNNRFSGGGMRFLKFKKWLEDMQVISGGIEAIYFEEVRRHVGTTAAHVYGGLLAILTSWCEENKIPYEGIPVGTIKKHATGKGNSGKDIMIQAAKEKWPFQDVIDDNCADALWIMDLVKTK